MKKSLLYIWMLPLLILSIAVVDVRAPSTTVGVEPSSIVDPGLVPDSTFTVEIWVHNVSDLAGLEFKLGYDTAVLTATLIEYGDIFGATYFPLISEINDTEGYLHYSIMELFGEPGFYGDGRAAIINFTVDSLGESALDLYDTKLGDSDGEPIVHTALDCYFSNVAVVQYTLTIAVDGFGTTSPVPGPYVYDAGTLVEVDAIPDSGYMLDHWLLDDVDVGSADPYSVTMDADHVLRAVFAETTPVEAVIESCNQAGDQKDLFDLGEAVYVTGGNYSSSTTYNFYIVVDEETWSDGMTIPERVPDTATTISSNIDGDIPPTAVWSNPQTVGKYDIVVDVNGNDQYDAGIDALDDNDIEVTGGFFVIPEFPSFIILPLFMTATLLAAIMLGKKTRKKKTI